MTDTPKLCKYCKHCTHILPKYIDLRIYPERYLCSHMAFIDRVDGTAANCKDARQRCGVEGTKWEPRT